jgi:thiamine-monophosphate kinase
MDRTAQDGTAGTMKPRSRAQGPNSDASGDGHQETLADLGEWELIRRLGAFAPPGQFADDAALLNLPGGGSAGDGPALVVNTDVLVEGIHFSDSTTAAADVGWRAAAANLSDLAAMGCSEVVGITVALVAPAATPWDWVEGVYGGLREALDTYGGVLLGGDCSGGAQRLLAITAIGRLALSATAPGSGPIRRGDGRPGDRLVCTGPHGLSRLGLALLQGQIGAETLDPALVQRAIAAHQRPVPRFDAVRALMASRPAAAPWRVGGCDSSDGLAAAAAAIAASSGCSARLDRPRLPLDPAMTSLPQAQAWGLGGGEDFELVLALAPAWAEALIAALPGTTPIGELVAGEAGALGWMGGEAWSAVDGEGAASSGYSHFSGGVSGWGGSRKTRENASPKADCLKMGTKIGKWTFPSRPSAPSVWS